MPKSSKLKGRLPVISALALAVAAAPAWSAGKDFTFSEKANDRLAKKLNIPIYFTVPKSTWAPLAGGFNTTDVLLASSTPLNWRAELESQLDDLVQYVELADRYIARRLLSREARGRAPRPRSSRLH